MSSAAGPDGTAGATGPGAPETVTKSEPAATISPPLAREQAQLIPEVVGAPSASALYEGRLRQIWEATHGGFSPPAADSGSTEAWDLVWEAAQAVVNLALIGAAVAEQIRLSAGQAGGLQDSGLTGDPATVEFLVSSAAEQLSPDALPAFITGTLVPTVGRLQNEVTRNGDVSRERIVDIVLAALDQVRGTGQAGRLVGPMLGYLNGEQRDPTVGYYTTSAMLAQFLIGLTDRQHRLFQIFLYHFSLHGLWRLLQEDTGTEFNQAFRQVVSVSAGNAAMNLWQVLPRRAAGAPGTDVVIALRRILTSTARELPVTEDDAAIILDALGFGHPEARAALTVLNELGALGGPWTADLLDLARIEASGAVIVIARRTSPDQVASRLYNATVSLQSLPAPEEAAPLRARMLLAGVALRWALSEGSDVMDALDRLEALDCMTSYLRAFGPYQDAGYERTAGWAAVAGLASTLAGLRRRLPLERPNLATKRARYADAISRVQLNDAEPPADPSREGLIAAVQQAIEALERPGEPPAEFGDRTLDLAAQVRYAFEVVLGQAGSGVGQLVAELTERRRDARTEFVTLYEPFMATSQSRLGTGPPVVARAADAAEWNAIETAMLHDQGSLIPVLIREFSP